MTLFDMNSGDGTIPTIKVKSADTESGFVIINAHDLTDKHELFAEPEAGKPSGKASSKAARA